MRYFALYIDGAKPKARVAWCEKPNESLARAWFTMEERNMEVYVMVTPQDLRALLLDIDKTLRKART